MRILYVGDNGDKYNGARFYNSSRRFFNGFIRNGHDVIAVDPKFMAKYLGIINSRSFGKKPLRKKLLDITAIYRPHMIALMHADMVTPETIQEMRDIVPDAKVIQINIDPLFSSDNIAKLRSKLSVVDASFATTGGPTLNRITTSTAVAAHIPNAADLSIDAGNCAARNTQEIDLIASVGGVNQDRERERIPLLVEEKLPELNFSYHAAPRANLLWGHAYVDTIANSKMGLNLSHAKIDGHAATAEERHLYSSDRLAQYMGNGLLTFIQTGNALEDLFSPEEAVFFGSDDELIEKLAYFHANDDARMQVAHNGWQKIHTDYSERRITQFMIDTVFDQKHSHAYAWDTTVFTG